MCPACQPNTPSVAVGKTPAKGYRTSITLPHPYQRSGFTRFQTHISTASGFRSSDKTASLPSKSSCHGAVHCPPWPTLLICPSINCIAAAPVQQSPAKASRLEVSTLVLIGSTFSMPAQVRPLKCCCRIFLPTPAMYFNAVGYQEAEIPKCLPYLDRLSSPLAYCPCGTAHAPYLAFYLSLLTISGFRHVPKDTLFFVPCTTLSYPAIRSAFAGRTDCASFPLQSCYVTVTSAAQ